jgi:hypothetical protein
MLRSQTDNKIGAVFGLRCYDKDGNLKWQDVAYNLVTTAGFDYLLEAALGDNTTIATFYAGLTDGSPTVAESDTLSSKAWTEVIAYTGDRKAWSPGAAASGQIDNSGSLAVFEITTDGTTVGGAFLTEAQTGTTGLLFNVAPLQGGDRTVSDGDTIELEVRFNVNNQ